MLPALLIASGTFWALWLALFRAPPACPHPQNVGSPTSSPESGPSQLGPSDKEAAWLPLPAPPPSERPAHRQALRDPDSSVFCQHRLFQEAKPFPRNIFKHVAPTEQPLNRAGERSPHTSERLWALAESSTHWEVGSWSQQPLSPQALRAPGLGHCSCCHSLCVPCALLTSGCANVSPPCACADRVPGQPCLPSLAIS